EFVTRVPNHIPALMRLVEICVDGGLEATMYDAQAQLADAYLAAGAASEARFIAEDLVAREPWEKAHIERVRRALVLVGETDPDSVIASRLAGESPFISTDIYGSELPVAPESSLEPSVPLENDPAAMDSLLASLALAEQEPVKKPSATEQRCHTLDQGQFKLSANAIDLPSIPGDFDEPALPPPAARTSGHIEVDISLDEFHAAPAPTPAPVRKESSDLDAVFGSMRDQAARRSGLNEA